MDDNYNTNNNLNENNQNSYNNQSEQGSQSNTQQGDSFYSYNRGSESGQNTYSSQSTGNTYAFEKSENPLKAQYAMDKIRTIVYFLGYKAMMKSSDYDSFVEITSLLNDIYQCRNMNHRGSSQSQWQKNTIAKIIPLKSLYYFKFLGVLAQYIEYIKEGWRYIPELRKYSESIEKQKISDSQPKVVR